MGKLNDKWLRLVGVPLIGILANYIFFDPENEANEIHRATALALSIAETLILWESIRIGIILARKKFPSIKLTNSRIVFQVVWFIGLTVCTRFLITYVYDITEFWGYSISTRSYWVNILVPFFFIVPIGAIYEAIYFYVNWSKTSLEAERLKKDHLQSQLESLKSQLNPHFLFNSLSTLSSLVAENPVQAETFIEELASTYRYVLKVQDQVLSTLGDEVRFIKTYYHLLKTRFDEGLLLQVEINEQFEDYLVPSLTLQLLVENAVKHNALSQNQPLLIRIFTDDAGNLFVWNNLNKRKTTAPSTQTGLSNIISKYRLLNQPEVIISENSHCFQVQVSLISPKDLAEIKSLVAFESNTSNHEGANSRR